jgi:hypothetical protein
VTEGTSDACAGLAGVLRQIKRWRLGALILARFAWAGVHPNPSVMYAVRKPVAGK